ncbi:O-antigen ligase family protein [Paremcibacter congregatus]|uniref:O-antigen ligase family protein n=1 Tax=Paremcibacter congregatus TaxID=2043170 RepID=UPI003A8E3397
MSKLNSINFTNKTKFTNLVLLCTVFTAIFIPGHMYGWLLEKIFGILLTLIALTFVSFNGLRKTIWGVSFKDVLLLFLFLQTLFVLGYLYTISLAQEETGVRDYVNIYKYIIQALIILFVTFSLKSFPLLILERMIKISLLFALIVFVCFLIDVPILTPLFRNVIYAEAKMRFGIGLFRTTAPFENPNYLGFYLLMALNYLLFFSRSKNRRFYLLLCVMLLFATGSRSAWASAIIVLMFYYFLHVISLSGPSKKTDTFSGRLSVAILAPVLVVGLGCVFWDQLSKVRRLMEIVDSFGSGGAQQVASATARFNSFTELTEVITISPLFGNGTYKYTLYQVIDSQIFSWLLSIGFVGTSVVLIFYILVFVAQLKVSSCRQHSFGVLSFWASLFAMLQAGAFLDNVRMFFLFVIFITMVHFVLNYDVHNKNSHKDIS